MSENERMQQLFEQVRDTIETGQHLESVKQILIESRNLGNLDILYTYLHDQNWHLRSLAAEALGQLEQPEVAQRLIERFELESEEDEEQVQVQIAISLRQQKTLLALQALIEIAKERTLTDWVRGSALQSIAVSASRNIFDPLFELLLDPDEWELSESIFNTFTLLEESDHGIASKLATVLRHMTASESNEKRAIHFLGRRRFKPAFDLVIPFLANADPEFRRAAAVALGAMEDNRARPKLLTMVDDSDQQVKRAVSEAIEQLQTGEQEVDTSLREPGKTDFRTPSYGKSYRVSWVENPPVSPVKELKEKLETAIYSIAQSTDSLQARLWGAYIKHLSQFDTSNVPWHMSADFELLKERLTNGQRIESDGTISDSAKAMDDATAKGLIEKIIALYKSVCLVDQQFMLNQVYGRR